MLLDLVINSPINHQVIHRLVNCITSPVRRTLVGDWRTFDSTFDVVRRVNEIQMVVDRDRTWG